MDSVERIVDTLLRLLRHAAPPILVNNVIFDLRNEIVDACVVRFVATGRRIRRMVERAEEVDPAFAAFAQAQEFVEVRCGPAVVAAEQARSRIIAQRSILGTLVPCPSISCFFSIG